MGFLRRLLGGASGEASARPPGSAEAASEIGALLEASEGTFDASADRPRVTLWLRLVDADFENEREQMRAFTIEDRVMRALDESGVGEHDTNSLERGYLAIRLIGDDADAVVAVVSPLLADLPEGSYLAVRHGPAGSAEERVAIGRPSRSDPSRTSP